MVLRSVAAMAEIRFWILANHYLNAPVESSAQSYEKAERERIPSPRQQPVSSPRLNEEEATVSQRTSEAGPKFGVLSSGVTARGLEWERARASEMAGANVSQYELSQKLTDLRILLSRFMRARRRCGG